MAAIKTVSQQLHDAMELLRKKNLELTAAEKTIRELRREDDTRERIRKEIYGLSEYPPQPPAWLLNPMVNSHKTEAAMTMWSDWHYGEVVDPDEVGGVNEFNTAIAKRRVKKLVETTLGLCFEHHKRSLYPGAVVMLGGDMLTGDIHEELLATNEVTSSQAVNDLTDILCWGIDEMASKFGKLFVPCVVGNHGRNTRKPRMKQRVFSSLEWLIYCNLERHFKDTRSIKFLVSNEADAYFNVFGRRFLLTHGDSLGVKGGDGIIGAIGPIMRGAMKVGRSSAVIGREFDTVCMGHWHQYIFLPSIIVNNSLIGLNEYGHLGLRAPNTMPSQALWFCHPDYGITASREVFVEKRKVSQMEKAWVSWQT